MKVVPKIIPVSTAIFQLVCQTGGPQTVPQAPTQFDYASRGLDRTLRYRLRLLQTERLGLGQSYASQRNEAQLADIRKPGMYRPPLLGPTC
jgi:hypothetical protein